MNCPTCKRADEFVFENVSRIWRCDRCHERFLVIPTNDGSDRAEKFERAFPTNADRIRGMSDEDLSKEITRNPPIPCRMCEYYSKLSYCDAPRDFTCVTAYAEALTLDWLQQPAETEGTE